MRPKQNVRAVGVGLLGVLVAGLSLALAAPAAAQSPGGLVLAVQVVHISDAQGKVDPRAKRLHAKLRKQFRYESLRVLESKRLKLALNDVGELQLPNGRRLRVRPLVRDKRGALVAVDVEGALQTDVRVRPRHLVVIGAHSHKDGKLVISLEMQ
ncbi:MAG: hypothetical protein MJE66_19950 [Proteobacteria bacterium]|nr:hypothetical protein [Pseudomonadota bacterium]